MTTGVAELPAASNRTALIGIQANLGASETTGTIVRGLGLAQIGMNLTTTGIPVAIGMRVPVQFCACLKISSNKRLPVSWRGVIATHATMRQNVCLRRRHLILRITMNREWRRYKAFNNDSALPPADLVELPRLVSLWS